MLRSLLSSRLGRRITLAVACSILVVEVIILVPSYLRHRQDQIAHQEATARTALLTAFEHRPDDSPATLLAHGADTLGSSPVVGAALYARDGRLIGIFGEPPMLQPGAAGEQPSRFSGDGRRYEYVWRPPQSGLPFTVVARLDSAGIGAEMTSFVWRIVGLVLIITGFVTLTTMLIVERSVLRPVLALSRGLTLARRDSRQAENYVPSYGGDDEIGELTVALRELLHFVSESRRRELQASEQRFRDFADAASDFFWELDAELRFSYFSERMSAVAGVQPSRLLGRSWEDTTVRGLDPESLARHLADLRAHRPFRNFVHPGTLPDGRSVYLSLSGKPVFDETGAFRGYRGSGSDITERIEAEHELELARERAEDANRAKSEFLALMSHELRTPLNAILGFSEMIETEALGTIGNPSYKEYAHDIRQGGAHLLRLINDILDLSKIESGRYTLRLEQLGLADAVDEALRMVRKAAAEKEIALAVEVAPDCPDLQADSTALIRMLTNLLANAVKFTEPGGLVTVRAHALADGMEVAVEDSGVGIAEADLGRIFEPFQQAENTYQRRQEGTGLGLAIVRSLMQAHGGSASASSVVGEGTTMVLHFPEEAVVRHLPRPAAAGGS